MCTPKNQQSHSSPSTSLVLRQQVPFEKDILAFLLAHKDEITNSTVRDFVNRYIAWLDQCAKENTKVGPAGTKTLERFQLNSAYYGYYPSDVAYWFSKLNKLFFMLMGNAYIRINQPGHEQDLPPLNTHLSMELLSGLSSPLGFYLLIRHFQTDAHEQGKAWIERACDLFGEFRDLETWRPDRETIEQSVTIRQLLGMGASVDEPYYNTSTPGNISDPRPAHKIQSIPTSPYAHSGYNYDRNLDGAWRVGYNAGHYGGYQQCLQETNVLYNHTGMIIEAERKRLVDFLKSLRQTLDIVNEDPLLVENQWEEVPIPPQPPQSPKDNGNNSEHKEDDLKKLFESTKDVFQ